MSYDKWMINPQISWACYCLTAEGTFTSCTCRGASSQQDSTTTTISELVVITQSYAHCSPPKPTTALTAPTTLLLTLPPNALNIIFLIFWQSQLFSPGLYMNLTIFQVAQSSMILQHCAHMKALPRAVTSLLPSCSWHITFELPCSVLRIM